MSTHSTSHDFVPSPILILTEGEDEKDLVSAILESRPCPSVGVRSFCGVNNLRNELQRLAKSASFKRGKVKTIGVILDANGSYEDRLTAVSDALDSCLGVRPSRAGIVEPRSSYSIGVFISPNNFDSGSIDTIGLQCFRDHALMPCAQRAIECAESSIDYAPQRRDKHILRVLLALEATMTNRLGHAVKKKIVEISSPAFDDLRAFVLSLTATIHPDDRPAPA
jgi:hypothetical protein